jgi:hypothetical protein
MIGMLREGRVKKLLKNKKKNKKKEWNIKRVFIFKSLCFLIYKIRLSN